jgi:hypothetical protein
MNLSLQGRQSKNFYGIPSHVYLVGIIIMHNLCVKTFKVHRGGKLIFRSQNLLFIDKTYVVDSSFITLKHIQ